MNGPGFLERLEADARARPDRVFATFGDDALTLGRLHAEAADLATHLSGSGAERAAVMMDNSLAQISVIFGLAMAGVTWIPVNPRVVGQGLRYILEHSDPQIIICDEHHRDAIEASGAPLSECRSIESPHLAQIFAASPSPSTVKRAPAGADFALMYTSGTTGPPKGVQVTPRMMDFAGEGVRIGSGAEDGDVMFLWEPLCHIGGAQMLILPLLVDVHLAMVPRFSASKFWDQVAETGATHIHYLGGILQMLLKQPARGDDKAHGVRTAWGGGCPAETWTAFEGRFAIPIRECYGMSEASSLTSVNLTGKVGAVGRPMDWLDVSIQDPGPDGRGEILVREREPGALFQGYFRNPEATARALRNGTLHTGDLGSIDADGDLWFHGRLGDAIRVRGENVSAWEVESVAGSHPQVEECAAVGVEAEVGEQEIKLFVRLAAEADLGMQALSEWLRPRLASFQLPRYYEPVAGFPRTPSQRVRKGELDKSTDASWDRRASC
ncbi:MAG: AMP-binding protein [Pseudomonadota bacterium]